MADSMPVGQKQLAALQKKNSSLLGRLVMLLAVVFVGCLGGGIYLHSKHDSGSAEIERSATEELASIANDHAYQLVLMSDAYVEWLATRGIPLEQTVLAYVTDVLAASALELELFPENSDEGGLYALLFSAFIRLCFLIIACWRIWLFALIVSALITIVNYRPYEGDDYLGQSGIGRVFYSGVYAGLNKLTKNGEIDTFMTGLACPFTVSKSEAEQSELVGFLKSVGAYNETNLALAAVVLAYPSLPSYVVPAEHADGLRKFMQVGELPAATLQVLKRAFELYKGYHQDKYDVPDDVQAFRQSMKREDLGFEPPKPEPMPLDHFSVYLASALCRVLDHQMAHDLRRVDAAELATVLLAAQAGRTIVHIRVGHQWLPRSAMPQLSARAVLHSIAAFPREYDYESRTRIRRALIYAWRKSAFGPVTFPKDLTNRTQALRQWTEILFSMPHDVLGNSLEVELFGLSWRSHKKFVSRFFQWVASLTPENRDHGVFITHAELLFAPARHLIRVWNEVVEPETTKRIIALVALVSERQRLKESLLSSPTADPESTVLPRYEKILPPMDAEEQARLCELHELTALEMQAWDGIRVVLNSYSWMGRRVGHMAVPASSLVCMAFKTEELLPDRNSYGLVGRRGLVPLRSSRLQEHWGRSWKDRFIFGDTEKIARSEEEYQRLLSGRRVVEADSTPPDSGIPPSTSLG